MRLFSIPKFSVPVCTSQGEFETKCAALEVAFSEKTKWQAITHADGIDFISSIPKPKGVGQWLLSKIYKSPNCRFSVISDFALSFFEKHSNFEYKGPLLHVLRDRWSKKEEVVQRLDLLLKDFKFDITDQRKNLYKDLEAEKKAMKDSLSAQQKEHSTALEAERKTMQARLDAERQQVEVQRQAVVEQTSSLRENQKQLHSSLCSTELSSSSKQVGHFEQIWKSREDSGDVEFRLTEADEKEQQPGLDAPVIKAHRVFLYQCPYFKSYFQSQSSYNNYQSQLRNHIFSDADSSKTIKIEWPLSKDQLQGLLYYLYTGQLQTVSIDHLMQMAQVAHFVQDAAFEKLCLEKLKRILIETPASSVAAIIQLWETEPIARSGPLEKVILEAYLEYMSWYQHYYPFALGSPIFSKEVQPKLFEIFSLDKTPSPLAKVALGVCLSLGLGTEKDQKKAFNIFSEDALAEEPFAQVFKGHCHMYGRGINNDQEMALACFKIAADKGNSSGQAFLGWELYQRKKDQAQGVNLLNLAAAQGSAGARSSLSIIDEERSFEFVNKAANQGHPDSLFRLAFRYEKAFDLKKAVPLYLAAATTGDPLGQYYFASCCWEGKGTPKDAVKAKRWALRAANQNCSDYARNSAMRLLETIDAAHPGLIVA